MSAADKYQKYNQAMVSHHTGSLISFRDASNRESYHDPAAGVNISPHYPLHSLLMSIVDKPNMYTLIECLGME